MPRTPRRPCSSPAARPASAAPPPSTSPRTGWTVYATARRPETSPTSAAGAGRSRSTSPTRPRCAAAVDAVEAEAGRRRRAGQQRRLRPVGRGREVPMERGPPPVRDQRLRPRAHVPARAARHARAGLGPHREHLLDGRQLTFPGGGFYHATKYAVEAITDALRFEVRRLRRRRDRHRAGADPDRVRRHGRHGSRRRRPAAGRTPTFNARGRRAHAISTTGPLARLGGPPEAVAKAIEQGASRAARPRARYTVTPSARAMIAQRALLPDAAGTPRCATQVPATRPRLSDPTSVQLPARRGLNRPTRPVVRSTVARDGHHPAHGPRAPSADRRRAKAVAVLLRAREAAGPGGRRGDHGGRRPRAGVGRRLGEEAGLDAWGGGGRKQGLDGYAHGGR